MSISDVYAAVNLLFCVVYLGGLVAVAIRHRGAVHESRPLRWVFPVTAVIYILFGIAYGLVLLMPAERDDIGRMFLRPAVPSMLSALFFVVWLVTREAARLQASELARLTEQRQYLKLREALVLEKENFVAIALHEINTPLTLLSGYVSMLTAAQSLEEAQQLADAIHRTSGRFRAMKTLFDARLHRLYLSAFDLCDCVAQAIGDPWLYVATRKQPGEVEILHSCDGPITVEADPEKIRVAVWELVRNALKAVEAENGRVAINVTASNGHAIIIVEDNGVGIPADYRPRIWDPGSQFYEEMTTRRNEGTGHGLYTVRHIMQEHGGEAALDWSAEGVGSRFILYLPRQ